MPPSLIATTLAIATGIMSYAVAPYIVAIWASIGWMM